MTERVNGLDARLSARRLVEAADVYRIPIWILARPFYAILPIRLLFRLTAARGILVSVLSPRRSEVLRRMGQVDLGADARERRRIARRHFRFVQREQLATLWPCLRGFQGGERIEIQGKHHLDEALSGGRGAILVTPHFGYPRLLKPVLVSHGYPALLIGPPQDVRISGFPPLTRLGSAVRRGALRLPWPEREDEAWMQAAGYDLMAQLNIRPHLAALARNQILISLPDGRGGQAMHRVSMLGVDVLLSPNVLSMARETGAALLPAFVGDNASGADPMGARLVIDPPVALPTDGRDAASVAAGLQSLAQVFESWIRASPHLWLGWSGPSLAWWGSASGGKA